MFKKIALAMAILGMVLGGNPCPTQGSGLRDISPEDAASLFLPLLFHPGTPDYQIAFISDRDGSNDIYVMQADGAHTRQVTFDDYDEVSVEWSADGKKLLYSVFAPTNVPPFLYYLIDLETKSSIPFDFDPPHALDPDWSPDGTQITFSGTPYNGTPEDGHPGIYVMNADGSNSQRLTSDTQDSTAPRWSQDGSWIVYIANDVTGFWLEKMHPDGIQAFPLTGIEIDPGFPVWSGDGTKVAFIKDDSNNNDCIYVVMVATLQQDPLWCPDTWIGSLDWTTDGGRILLTQSSHGASDVLALDLTPTTPITLTQDTNWDFMARWSPVTLP